jgi:hypothetical protein
LSSRSRCARQCCGFVAQVPAFAQAHGQPPGEGHAHPHKHSHPKKTPAKSKKKPSAATNHSVAGAHRHAPIARSAHGGHTHGPGGNGHDEHGIETEHLFGFTIGSDVGHTGEREAFVDITGGFGKRDGYYSALSKKFEVGITPVENFHVAVGTSASYHAISGVTGLENVNRLTLESVSLDMRYRFLDRSKAPFGLTFVVEPHLSRVEEVSGEIVAKQAVEFKLAADQELFKDRLWAAFNALYEPERVQNQADEIEKESTLGFSGALTAQVAKDFFLGGEARYLRKYEGAALDMFVGDALFVGPTMFAKLSKQTWLAAAWGVQVAGRSVDTPDLALDLEHFTHHQAKLKFGVNF